jgi:hypothetical protein
MLKLKTNLDYKFKYSEEELKNLDATKNDVTLNYLAVAINSKYKDGLEGQKRRIWGRIQKKFADIEESKVYEIEIEEAEKDFILDAFKEAKYPANMSSIVTYFEEEFIEKMTAKKEEDKKAE